MPTVSSFGLIADWVAGWPASNSNCLLHDHGYHKRAIQSNFIPQLNVDWITECKSRAVIGVQTPGPQSTNGTLNSRVFWHTSVSVNSNDDIISGWAVSFNLHQKESCMDFTTSVASMFHVGDGRSLSFSYWNKVIGTLPAIVLVDNWYKHGSILIYAEIKA